MISKVCFAIVKLNNLKKFTIFLKPNQLKAQMTILISCSLSPGQWHNFNSERLVAWIIPYLINELNYKYRKLLFSSSVHMHLQMVKFKFCRIRISSAHFWWIKMNWKFHWLLVPLFPKIIQMNSLRIFMGFVVTLMIFIIIYDFIPCVRHRESNHTW